MKKDKKVIFLIVTLIVLLIVFVIELVSFGILKANNGKHIYEIEIDKDDDNISNKYYRDENVIYIFDSIPDYDEINKEYSFNDYIYDFEHSVKAKYKDNNMEIEVFVSGTENNIYSSYIKVNNNIVYEDNIYLNGFRTFKLNDYYIVEYSAIAAQCSSEFSIIINKEGKFIGNTNVGSLAVNSYSKEKNQINGEVGNCGICIDYCRNVCDKDSITYQITDNELKIVNSAVKKDDVYYVYDDKGNYTTFSSEGTVKKVELNDKIYYFDIKKISDKESNVKVYDNNLKYLWNITGLIYCSEPYFINSDNTITFDAEIDGIFVVFDDNMNLIYESKKYEMFAVIKDYVIVIQDNKVKILDLKENEITSFDELPDEYEDISFIYSGSEIKFYISNWRYTYNLETKEKNIRK